MRKFSHKFCETSHLIKILGQSRSALAEILRFASNLRAARRGALPCAGGGSYLFQSGSVLYEHSCL